MIKTCRFHKLLLTDSPWIGYYSPSLVMRYITMPRRAFMSSIAFAAPFGKSPFEKITQTFLDDPTQRFAKVSFWHDRGVTESGAGVGGVRQ